MNYQLFEDLAHSLACVERNYELVREVWVKYPLVFDLIK